LLIGVGAGYGRTEGVAGRVDDLKVTHLVPADANHAV